MVNPYDLQQANSLANYGPGAPASPPALNALAQPYQPLNASAPNALGMGQPSLTGDPQRDRALQFIAANKLALDGPNGDFLRALKAFHNHFSNPTVQASMAGAPQAPQGVGAQPSDGGSAQ